MQGDIAARSNVELRNGIAVGEDLDDRSIRAVLSGGGGGGETRRRGTVKESQTLSPLLPGDSRLESSLETRPALTEDTDVSCSLGVAKGAADTAGVPGVVAAYRT